MKSGCCHFPHRVLCGGCAQVMYCSDACADDAWATHWKQCGVRPPEWDDPNERYSQYREEGVKPSGEYSLRDPDQVEDVDSEDSEAEAYFKLPPGYEWWRGLALPKRQREEEEEDDIVDEASDFVVVPPTQAASPEKRQRNWSSLVGKDDEQPMERGYYSGGLDFLDDD